jgi:hypothetical protein
MLKRRIAVLLVALVAATVGALAVATPANAGSYLHKIRHTSGLCLEVPGTAANPGGSMVFGEQLKLAPCAPKWNQLFWFADAGNAWWYYLRPGHNQWCLMPGAYLYNTTVIQYGCNWGDSSEKWILEAPYGLGAPERMLRNVFTGWCLTVDGPWVDAYVRLNSHCGQFLAAGLDYWYLD